MNILFQTPRLTLRRFTKADAPLVQQLNSSPEVLKYHWCPIFNKTKPIGYVLVL
jgi:RimJ/RimL family protein N-acetyltransferase